MSSRVPLTRVNLQIYTGVGRDKIGRWLDKMVASEVLDVDSYLLAVVLLPHFLLLGLLGIVAPLSALLGILYAWQYNSSGGRSSLVEEAKRRLR